MSKIWEKSDWNKPVNPDFIEGLEMVYNLFIEWIEAFYHSNTHETSTCYKWK